MAKVSKRDELRARLRLQQMEVLLRAMSEEVLRYGVLGHLSCNAEQVDAAVASLRAASHVVLATRRASR